jgi:hypothetical protein
MNGLAYAGRQLLRAPVFTITAELTMALGIAGSTALFSVAHTVLIRPLPYTDADRLVAASVDYRKPNVRDVPFSNGDFLGGFASSPPLSSKTRPALYVLNTRRAAGRKANPPGRAEVPPL